VIKTLEAQVGQFLQGCKCPVSRGIVVQEQDPVGDIPHVQIFMNDGPNPLTWDAQLLSYWFSRNPAVFQDSVLRHREVGRTKDLSAPPRTNRTVKYIRPSFFAVVRFQEPLRMTSSSRNIVLVFLVFFSLQKYFNGNRFSFFLQHATSCHMVR
jgi:hypothetical protein